MYRLLKSVLLAGVLSGGAWAAAASDVKSASLTVCLEQWYPYYSVDEDGVARGAAVDALSLALAELGHSADFQILPYARCLRSVRLGRVDAVLTVSPGEDGLTYVDVPLAYWKIAAVVHVDDPLGRFESLDQFAAYTPIYFVSYTYPEILRPLIEKPGAVGISSQEDVMQPLRILQSRRRHVSFEDMLWAKQVAREEGLDVKVLEPAILTEPNYLAFSPELKGVAESVEDVLRQMQADGRLAEIFARYLAEDVQPAGVKGGEGS